MKAHEMLAGAAIAITLAISTTGAVGAHWDDYGHGPGMGPGMRNPGTGLGPNDDWHQPARGIYPDDWWDYPGVVLMPRHR